MYPVTARYLEALRGSHKKVVRAEHLDPFTGTVTRLQVLDGAVTVDAGSNIRRKADLTLPGSEATWRALDTVGGELTISRGLRYADGSIEWVPLGVFVVEGDNIDYGQGGTITISAAPDRASRFKGAGLPPNGRASVATNAAWQEIQRLAEGAWTAAYPFPGWATLDKTATTPVGWLLWDDGDREAAMRKLVTDNSLELFFDAQGKAVLRKAPTLTPTSKASFVVDAGVTGVLLGAARSRDRTRVFNAVEVDSSATDYVFETQVVKNTNAADPLNVNGPLGYRPLRYSSASLRSSIQAKAAGKTLLAKYTGAAKQLTLQSLQNDALDAGDVISVILPKVGRNTPRPIESHIIDSLRIPLRPDGAMEIQTRSTVPEIDAA